MSYVYLNGELEWETVAERKGKKAALKPVQVDGVVRGEDGYPKALNLGEVVAYDPSAW